MRLTELQEIADQGDWERVEILERQLVADLAQLNSTPRQSLLNPTSRQLIIDIQRLLVAAQASCTTRLEQIKPLVDALGQTRATSGTP